MSGWSLRSRVTASVAALVIATLVTLSVAVDLALDRRLRSDLRSRLVDRAAVAVMLDNRVAPQSLANRLTGQGVVATIESADGSVAVGRAGGAGALPKLRARLRAARNATVTREGELLVVRQPLLAGRTLVLEGDLSEINRTLDRLAVVEVAVSLILIAMVGLVISQIARAALAPLDRMTSTARSIAAGSRGSRLRPASTITEIGRTAAAIDEMLDALEASERSMRDFLSDASHELRTPLAGLQSGAETLLRASLSRSEQEALAVQMVRESQRATRLLNDLLAVTRLEVQSVELAGCDLSQVAESACEDLTRRVAGVEVGSSSSGSALALCNRDLMAQVLANLLDNAARAGGPIEVTIVGSSTSVELAVSDHGPGVPTGDRERIFDRFVRLDSARARDAGGNGLGLAITRALVTKQHGSVRCTERPDGAPGARFVVTLPTASHTGRNA